MNYKRKSIGENIIVNEKFNKYLDVEKHMY